MNVHAKFATLLGILALAVTGSSYGQQPKTKAAQTPAASATPQNESSSASKPPPPGWAARCSSPSRNAPLECAVEQSAVLSTTGQLLVLVNIRVPGDTHQPMALVQLPLGLNLPVGAKLQVDDGKTIDLQIQTCENRGCFASTQIAPDVLTALKSGKQLKVSFQNLGKETITIPMPLTDFGAAYDKIK